MKVETKKVENIKKQCGLCQAKFEVWIDNLKMEDERKDKISKRLLNYCPACTIADGSGKN